MTEAAQKYMPETSGALSQAIGKRVTIRLHEPNGGYRDIVGILQSNSQLINSKSQSVFFSPDEIALWREIKPLPDLAGKGAPLSKRILELEKLSDLTWPAERVIEYGKWRLRIANGFTMRANSVLPIGAGPIGEPPIDLADAVNEVVKIYLENKLAPTFTIALPIYEDLDHYLEKTGWSLKAAANFLIRDIGDIAFVGNKEFTCEVLDFPSNPWLEMQSDQSLENLMLRYPARYGAIKIGEQIIAVGRIATAGTWSIVTRLYVAPAFRDKGLAKFLMNNLLAAANRDGATKVALQVDDENAAALALYESMGFRTHHKFVYRTLEKLRGKS
ncbi:MAG: GNAT family N-acetyltransferase [Actinomycetota bacterium]|nr:GNAT family N-acetyltransferase [Actinomycetota bacterium]